MAIDTNNPQDNWACFRSILGQLLENLEEQTELLKSLLEEGDHADHLDFIQQLQFDPAPQAVALLDDWEQRSDERKFQRQCRTEQFPNAIKPWTDDDDAELRALFKYGLNDAELAEFCGRTPEAIKKRRRRLGLMREAN